MEIKYPDIGICGLSCRLCPAYHRDGPSRCEGCKTESRMGAGCKFITCALKNKGVEFCWECNDNSGCDKWKRHVDLSDSVDSFKCYQTLRKDIEFIKKRGANAFVFDQNARLELLKSMILEYDDLRSKSYYCIAATVMDINDLRTVLRRAHDGSKGLNKKEKAKLLHSELDQVAEKKKLSLKLRK